MRVFGRFAASRAALIVIALLGAALLAGGSWALTGDSGTQASELVEPETLPDDDTPAPEAGDTPDTKTERYHGEDCTLATGLEGNWNHGAYVSAVAKDDDDATQVSDAAKSRCGKPLNAGKDGEKRNDAEEEQDVEAPEDDERRGKREPPGKSGKHRPGRGDDSTNGS